MIRLDLRKVLFLALLSMCSLTSTSMAQGFTDPAAWEQVTFGTGPILEVTPSRVTITLPATSEDNDAIFGTFGAFVQTACPLQGDFDVSVDFHLLVWPPQSGVRMGLNTAAANVNRISFGRFEPFGEVYYTTLNDGLTATVIPTTDLTGSLRLARSGGMLTAYYKDTGGNWVVMHAIPAPTIDLSFGLAAWSHSQFFADQAVQVAFDGFHVAEGQFPCFPAAEIAVTIDIIPGSFPNNINPRSNAPIPVAILADAFDATTVDPSTVRFGATGTEAPPMRFSLEDVNRDGRPDLLLQFRTRDTNIACGDTSASLTGQTFSGQEIEGTDAITTVGCR